MRFQIYRLRESHYEHFRWAPHTSGASQIKRKDYEHGGEVEAASAYAAWSALRDAGRPLRIGDLLEFDQSLKICKYVGFEDAHWVVPEIKPAEDTGHPTAPAPVEAATPGGQDPARDRGSQASPGSEP
jgi:hypothetical protein